MKTKGKIFISIILITTILSISIYYFKRQNNNLKAKTTTVAEINTEVKLDTSDETIEWSNYENREITLTKSITIKEGGVYNLTGTITNGLITIDTEEDVNLVLNNVSITNENGPAIYVENANQVVITTSTNSTNTLTDGSNYTNYEEEVDGVIYSKDDLILEGTGTLVINANKGDGVVGKDDLKINNGTYLITATDDAIRGKDSIYILDGNFTINALGDGLKSTNDTETDKGYIKIDNGNFSIISTLDGIQAETKVLISGGTFTIKTGGGASNSSDKDTWGAWRGEYSTSSDSAKGIKALDNIVITGGDFTFDTSDDSIHSNNYVGISGGEYNIASGDDGIHADKELIIDNGNINITKSYEGLEAETITINNGNINITASDDGINVAGGNDASAYNRPGAPNNTSSSSTLTINGGNITVDATGDGLDANGSIFINGGNTIVNGPTNNGNGTLDYDQECVITGGTFLGIGSSGMAQGMSNNSTQYNFMINLPSNYSNDTKITIEDTTGKELMTYTSIKTFSNLIFSSNSLSKSTYTIKINDSTIKTIELTSITNNSNSYSNRNNIPNRR